jgi:hypothetical protein
MKRSGRSFALSVPPLNLGTDVALFFDLQSSACLQHKAAAKPRLCRRGELDRPKQRLSEGIGVDERFSEGDPGRTRVVYIYQLWQLASASYWDKFGAHRGLAFSSSNEILSVQPIKTTKGTLSWCDQMI